MGEGQPELGQLTAGWWEYQRLAQGSRSERKALELCEPTAVWAAWTQVRDRVDSGGIEALQIVLALLDTAPDAASRGLVAAGPLEDLVHQHGGALIDDLDRLARQSPAFRQAMAGVWLSTGVLDADTERRLRPWLSGRHDQR